MADAPDRSLVRVVDEGAVVAVKLPLTDSDAAVVFDNVEVPVATAAKVVVAVSDCVLASSLFEPVRELDVERVSLVIVREELRSIDPGGSLSDTVLVGVRVLAMDALPWLREA